MTSGGISTTLLQRVLARDPAAWSRLVHLFTPLVYHWCRVQGVTRGDEDDVVQEVFLAVSRSVENLENPCGPAFRAWLKTLTRHRILDHLRRGGREEAQGHGGTSSLRQLEQLPETSPDDQAEIAALYRRALDLIAREFDARTVRVFRSTGIEGRPAGEVARELGMTAGALYQVKYRMVRRLREELKDLIE